ncbi:hypothetical protein P8452_36250 [Trifolium repens]|nr:hypothetical protein P8452_36250 [Trifolium repens]
MRTGSLEDEIKLRWKEKERSRNKLATYYKGEFELLTTQSLGACAIHGTSQRIGCKDPSLLPENGHSYCELPAEGRSKMMMKITHHCHYFIFVENLLPRDKEIPWLRLQYG